MANKLETLDREVKVVGFNSDTDLTDKSVRQNQQGISLEDLSYIKILPGVTYANLDDTDPTFKKGKLLLCEESADNFKLAIVRKSYGKFDSEPNVTLANTPTAAGNVMPADATYQNLKAYLLSDSSVELGVNVTIAGGVPTVMKVISDHTASLSYHNWAHDFKAGDTLVIAEGWEDVSGDPASAISIELAAADLVAHFMSLSTNLVGDVS